MDANYSQINLSASQGWLKQMMLYAINEPNLASKRHLKAHGLRSGKNARIKKRDTFCRIFSPAYSLGRGRERVTEELVMAEPCS